MVRGTLEVSVEARVHFAVLWPVNESDGRGRRSKGGVRARTEPPRDLKRRLRFGRRDLDACAIAASAAWTESVRRNPRNGARIWPELDPIELTVESFGAASIPRPPKAHNAVSRNFCASRPIPLRIDNDDEFGDLYADVHRPIPTAPDLLVALPDGDHDDDENVVDRILFGPQRDDWLLGRAPPAVETPAYWDDEDNGRPSKSDSAPRVLQKDLEGEARISGIPRGEVERVGDANEGRDSFVGSEARENLRDLDRAPIIPGFSAATGLPGPLFGAGGRVMDWSGSQGRTAIARMVSRSC
ncbi:hypothetical protein BHE74_00013345 [Ensete ventricosum]|nr:hypothetical protein BHE74_00013345 [Ensete ventricosum]